MAGNWRETRHTTWRIIAWQGQRSKRNRSPSGVILVCLGTLVHYDCTGGAAWVGIDRWVQATTQVTVIDREADASDERTSEVYRRSVAPSRRGP